MDYLSKQKDEEFVAHQLQGMTEQQKAAVTAVAGALRPLDDEQVARVLMTALERHSIDVHGPEESLLSAILRDLREQAQKRIMSV